MHVSDRGKKFIVESGACGSSLHFLASRSCTILGNNEAEAAVRIAQYLSDQRINFEKLFHPPAYTAQKRAKYLGVSGKQIAKAVLLRGPDGFLLAVLPGPKHIDTAALTT